MSNFKASAALFAVGLACYACLEPAFAQSWGLEVGRADVSDQRQLETDLATLRTLNARAHELDYPDRVQNSDSAKEELITNFAFDDFYPLLLRIANNPAAACGVVQGAESGAAYRLTALLYPLDSDHDARMMEFPYWKARNLRCREEALDECVKTGRLSAVFELPSKYRSNDWNSPKDPQSVADPNWEIHALKQCAIYQLKFKSEGVSNPTIAMPGFTSIVEGSVMIRFESRDGPHILIGETSAGPTLNPFVTSLKCKQPTNVGMGRAKIILKGCPESGDVTQPTTAYIDALDLVHPVYQLDAEGRVTSRNAGKDYLDVLVLAGDIDAIFPMDMEPHVPGMPPMGDVALNVFHYLVSSRLKLDAKAPDYPTLFRKTRSNSNALESATVTLELIHMPKPEPYPPRPARKPATH